MPRKAPVSLQSSRPRRSGSNDAGMKSGCPPARKAGSSMNRRLFIDGRAGSLGLGPDIARGRLRLHLRRRRQDQNALAGLGGLRQGRRCRRLRAEHMHPRPARHDVGRIALHGHDRRHDGGRRFRREIHRPARARVRRQRLRRRRRRSRPRRSRWRRPRLGRGARGALQAPRTSASRPEPLRRPRQPRSATRPRASPFRRRDAAVSPSRAATARARAPLGSTSGSRLGLSGVRVAEPAQASAQRRFSSIARSASCPDRAGTGPSRRRGGGPAASSAMRSRRSRPCAISSMAQAACRARPR